MRPKQVYAYITIYTSHTPKSRTIDKKKEVYQRMTHNITIQEMEMVLKNEENMRRSWMSIAEGESLVARCAKRRRREPATAALACEDNQSQKQQFLRQQQVDQSSTTNTTKRSSRFRGVSRS